MDIVKNPESIDTKSNYSQRGVRLQSCVCDLNKAFEAYRQGKYGFAEILLKSAKLWSEELPIEDKALVLDDIEFLESLLF